MGETKILGVETPTKEAIVSIINNKAAVPIINKEAAVPIINKEAAIQIIKMEDHPFNTKRGRQGYNFCANKGRNSKTYL